LWGCYDEITSDGRTMVLKQKRKILDNLHPGYSYTIKKISEKPDVIIVDADINAARLIEKLDGVISIPFTSTALLARDAGVPSVIFDSVGSLDPKASNARNVPVFDNVDSLSDWVDKIKN
jgi:polysaccharide biosynthesis PFTS motif protein